MFIFTNIVVSFVNLPKSVLLWNFILKLLQYITTFHETIREKKF